MSLIFQLKVTDERGKFILRYTFFSIQSMVMKLPGIKYIAEKSLTKPEKANTG